MDVGKQINVSFLILLSMPQFDIAMPLALLFVVVAAFFLNKRAEKKLKASIEEKEFQRKDALQYVGVLLVALLTFTLTSFHNPGDLFNNVLTSIFLGAYTLLLFTLTYLFSDLKKTRAQLFSICFGIVGLIVGIVSLLEQFQDPVTMFRAGAFFGLAIMCFAIAVYAHTKSDDKKAKWYLAIQPPALFFLLFVFFNILYFEGTFLLWFPFLMDIFGAIFAILIILYLSPLFNWKTVGIFAIMLTIIDIILVFSGPMVVAAETFSGLGLPVIIYLPSVPFVPEAAGLFGLGFRGLGLGDFFFAGILAIQTFNRFGKKYAYAAIASMFVSFTIWQAFLVDLIDIFDLGGFPATVFIITGWVPVAVIATLLHRKQKETIPQPIESSEPSNPSDTEHDLSTL